MLFSSTMVLLIKCLCVHRNENIRACARVDIYPESHRGSRDQSLSDRNTGHCTFTHSEQPAWKADLSNVFLCVTFILTSIQTNIQTNISRKSPTQTYTSMKSWSIKFLSSSDISCCIATYWHGQLISMLSWAGKHYLIESLVHQSCFFARSPSGHYDLLSIWLHPGPVQLPHAHLWHIYLYCGHPELDREKKKKRDS